MKHLGFFKNGNLMPHRKKKKGFCDMYIILISPSFIILHLIRMHWKLKSVWAKYKKHPFIHFHASNIPYYLNTERGSWHCLCFSCIIWQYLIWFLIWGFVCWQECFLTMNPAWYQSLIKVLLSRFPQSCRHFVDDCGIQYLVRVQQINAAFKWKS